MRVGTTRTRVPLPTSPTRAPRSPARSTGHVDRAEPLCVFRLCRCGFLREPSPAELTGRQVTLMRCRIVRSATASVHASARAGPAGCGFPSRIRPVSLRPAGLPGFREGRTARRERACGRPVTSAQGSERAGAAAWRHAARARVCLLGCTLSVPAPIDTKWDVFDRVLAGVDKGRDAALRMSEASKGVTSRTQLVPRATVWQCGRSVVGYV